MGNFFNSYRIEFFSNKRLQENFSQINNNNPTRTFQSQSDKLGCYPDKIRGSTDPSESQTNPNLQKLNNLTVQSNLFNNSNLDKKNSANNNKLAKLNTSIDSTTNLIGEKVQNTSTNKHTNNSTGDPILLKNTLIEMSDQNKNSLNTTLNNTTINISTNPNNINTNTNANANTSITNNKSTSNMNTNLNKTINNNNNTTNDNNNLNNTVLSVKVPTIKKEKEKNLNQSTTTTAAAAVAASTDLKSEQQSSLNKSNILNVMPASVPAETTQNRKKVSLGRGYSLMDWIRYTKETPDLAGNKGILRKVTYEELAKHNKEDDCWMAIFDKVYNLTPYMKYHPGGIDELMKGAGKNATDLFNEIHPWVNIHSMLEKCLIGNLVGIPIVAEENESKTNSQQKETKNETTKTVNKSEKASIVEKSSVEQEKPIETKIDKQPQQFIQPSKPITKLQIKKDLNIPVLDSYQSNETVNIVLYTKWKYMKPEFITIDKTESKQISSDADSASVVVHTTTSNIYYLVLFIYIKSEVYKYSLEMPAPTEDEYEIKVSKEGKVEIILIKIEKIHWWQMCPKLNFQAEIVPNSAAGVNFRLCELNKRTKISHDTDLYIFSLPVSTRMCVPIGYHVFVRLKDDNLVTKPYTAIDDSLIIPNKLITNGKQICLMIKNYEDGVLTPKLKSLSIGSKVEISNHAGSFRHERLLNCEELVLICAGTGITPMLRLLISGLQIESIKKIILLFFNKTMKDILWQEELEQFKLKYANSLQITHILSQAEPEWKGRKGKISQELLNELVIKYVKKPLICICGPKQFNEVTVDYIYQFGYTGDSVHSFYG